MKLKYYLRGLGLGLLMGSLIMGFSKSGPSKTDASEVASAIDADDENQGKTLSEIADSKLKEIGDESKEEVQEEASADADKEDETSNEETPEGSSLKEGDNETTSSKDNEEAVDSEDNNKETESEEPGKKEEVPKADEKSGNDVGAGLPLSERINAFSGGNDAPGTRAARGEGSSNASSSSDKKPNDPFAKSEGDSTVKSQENTGSNATVTETFTVSVYPGEGSYTVSRKLAGLGLVESAEVYDTFLCQNGYDKKIRTGNYEILKGATPEQIAKIITGNK